MENGLGTMNNALQAYRQNAESLVENLILENIDFVRKILSAMTANLPASCDRENLEQAGMVGLVEAARQFDPSKGTQFRSFAYLRIRGAITDEMRRNSGLPQAVIERIKRLKQVKEQLSQPATPELLAQLSGWSVDEVLETLEAMRFTRSETWGEIQPGELLGDSQRFDSAESQLQLKERKELLANCIEHLPDRERLIITLSFAEDLTLQEIGEVMGLSESRVSRLLTSAKFQLKEMIEYAER